MPTTAQTTATASSTEAVASIPAAQPQVLADAVAEITTALDALKRADRELVSQVRIIGRRLCEVKKIVGHGAFSPWVEAHFTMTDRTAEKYMRVARFLDKNELGSDLPLSLTALYALASPSMPPAVVEQVQQGEIQPTIGAIRAAKETEAPNTRPFAFQTSHLMQESIADLARLDDAGLARIIAEAPVIWKTPEKRRAAAITLMDVAARLDAVAEALGNEPGTVEKSSDVATVATS